jgi:hypothetical protein
VIYEDFVADPLSSLLSICSFLGVDPNFSFDTSHTYKTAFLPKRSISVRLALSGPARRVARHFIPGSARTELWGRIMSRRSTSPPKLDERSRDWLVEFFAEDILRLEQALGRGLPQWR